MLKFIVFFLFMNEIILGTEAEVIGEEEGEVIVVASLNPGKKQKRSHDQVRQHRGEESRRRKRISALHQSLNLACGEKTQGKSLLRAIKACRLEWNDEAKIPVLEALSFIAKDLQKKGWSHSEIYQGINIFVSFYNQAGITFENFDSELKSILIQIQTAYPEVPEYLKKIVELLCTIEAKKEKINGKEALFSLSVLLLSQKQESTRHETIVPEQDLMINFEF